MKKIFTSLMMLGCVAAMSAEVSLQKGANGEEVYANGETVTVAFEKTDFGGGYFMLQWDPEFYIISDADCTAEVSVDSPKGYVQFCGGSPEGCTSTSSTNPAVKKFNLKKGVAQNTLIDIVDMSGAFPFAENLESTITIKSGSQTYAINVVYLGENASIASVVTDGPVISVEGRVLNYNVAAPTQVTLYTISGQPAISSTVNGAGSLSLDGLPGGVYLYRAGGRTGKFVVR